MSDKFASGNIFSKLGSNLTEEEVTSLLAEGGVRVERIVSTGQATPEGKWYDQEQDEWVILLRGGAGLRIENEKEERVLKAGDWVYLPAHCRHRVEWTARNAPTIWLAVHVGGG